MKIAGGIAILVILVLPLSNASVILEVASNSSDEGSARVNEELFALYNSRRDFVYVTMIEDKNEFAHNRIKNDYNFNSYPEIFFNGGYEISTGSNVSDISNKIDKCSKLSSNIDINVNATWIECPCQRGLFITTTIKNARNTEYNGILRIYIAEYNSRYDDCNAMQYHFGFLEFAYTGNISIAPHDEVLIPVSWDSKINFPDIDQDDVNNLAVIAAVFNSTPHEKNAGNETNSFKAYYADAASIFISSNTPPTVSILSPKQNRLYIFGREILTTPYTLIIGGVDVNIYSYDESGINRIELYQDSEKLMNYNGAFRWHSPGRHSLTAIAYDNTGMYSEDMISAVLL
ncbi:MAG: hypothetical protein J7K61_00490 [Thermoplasmata archaeon]|nr:hypothetical protein [Thermoplasmata archaeon]